MDRNDIKDLQTFDTPAWADYLNSMPLSDLKSIEESKLYEASVNRVRELCDQLKKMWVQKDVLIDLMVWSCIAKLPMLLLGPWGTGKSMLVRDFSRGLGITPNPWAITTEDARLTQLRAVHESRGQAGHKRGSRPENTDANGLRNLTNTNVFDFLEEHDTRYFEYLLTRFTTPEELLGAVNVQVMLDHAIYLRQTRALLPRAEIVFLDEIFKANGTILNTLLSILNERIFHNAGVPWKVNLMMLFGASNEPPQEEELGAFFDRFPVRVLCDAVEDDYLNKLLNTAHTRHYSSELGVGPKPDKKQDKADNPVKQAACINDFRLLSKISLYKFGGANTDGASSDFTKTFLTVFRVLRHEYGISDRSLAHFYSLARAKALLEGRPRLQNNDCKVLYYCGKDVESARLLPTVVDSLIA